MARRAWGWQDRLILMLLYIGLGVASLLSPGCSSKGIQAQSQVAAVVAISANEVLPALEREYTMAMKMEVDVVASAGGTREEAQAEVDSVKEAWRPIWTAWDAFAEAHATWRSALMAQDEAGAIKAAVHARAAYCELKRLVPDLPSMPLADCKVKP